MQGKGSRKNNFTCLSIAAVWVFFLAACGLPGELKKQAKQKTGQITTARDRVSKIEADYQNLKTRAAFDFFRMYAEREGWDAQFKEARKLLNQADEDVTKGKVAFLIKENDKKKAPTLRIELARIDRMITKALQTAELPSQRMVDLERIRDNAPQLVKTAENSLQAIHPYISSLEDEFIPKAQEDHPARAEDIIERFTPLKTLERSAEAALAAAQAQLDLHQAGETADYGILGTKTDQVNTHLKAVKEGEVSYRAKIGELYQSYTKILKDMRIDHFVTVGRVSWDESSDYWREHNFIYLPSKVTPEVYTYFAKLDPNMVPAKYAPSRGGLYSVSVQQNQWNALNINPRQNWQSNSDNMAEFWIEDVFPKAYQKYTLIQNDKQEDTDWIEVDEEDYYDSFDYLGMEILSKPYGYFEEEKIQEASPPGMAFVGDGRYGEWRTDAGTGRSFWYYYGIYSFLNRGAGYRTYRGDWQRWQGKYRNREPYYGGGSSGRAYGTYGSHVRTDSRYRNTDFAKRGGLKTQTPSVRGAGPAGRGGGPGTRGK